MTIWYDFFEDVFFINIYEPNFTFFFYDLDAKLVINYEEKKSCCQNLLSFLKFPRVTNFDLDVFLFKVFVVVF